MVRKLMIGLLLATACTTGATAQEQKQSDIDEVGDKAESILRQPLKDIGIMNEKAPELLAAAVQAPYSLSGLRNCRDFQRAIGELNQVLGPDVNELDGRGQPLAGRLAEAGGKSVVNTLIPFRGLVREATGAAESDRRLQRALLAGGARRSFLKGYATARGCRI